MKFGVKLQNGNTLLGPLGMYLKTMKTQTLIQVHDPKLISRLPQRIGKLFEEAKKRFGLPGDYFYALDIDPYSNTISLTPPIANAKDNNVELTFDPYDEWIKRRGWPFFVMTVDGIDSFDMFNPNTAIDLQQPEGADSSPEGIAERTE